MQKKQLKKTFENHYQINIFSLNQLCCLAKSLIVLYGLLVKLWVQHGTFLTKFVFTLSAFFFLKNKFTVKV